MASRSPSEERRLASAQSSATGRDHWARPPTVARGGGTSFSPREM
ncbi:hypothetical protein [Streptomyces hirsutus]